MQALLNGEEVQGEQAGGAVEDDLRGIVDVAFQQRDLCHQWPQGLFGQREHGRGRVDTEHLPLRMRFGEGLELQAATGAEHQHLAIVGHMFGQQQVGHLLQSEETRHLPQRTVGIAGDGVGIGEGHRKHSCSNGERPLYRAAQVSIARWTAFA